MPNQPPSDDTHAKGGPQYHLAPCTRRGFTPQKTRNEPNKDNARCDRAAPVFNPHGSGGYANDPKMRNEPNSPYRASLAPPPAPPKNAKRTQKDNARCNRAAPVFNPGLSAEASPHQPNHRPARQIYDLPTTNCIMRNKPNPRTAVLAEGQSRFIGEPNCSSTLK